MSKKFKGKTCAYCGVVGASNTADHILARELVSVSLRNEIPIVPACRKCNQAKASLEHYAATVLPFGGRHSDAATRLNDDIPKRLKRNQKLHREIRDGMTCVWIKENGILVRTHAIPLDGKRIESLVDFIVRGLMFHHWAVALGSECDADVYSLTSLGETFFDRFKILNSHKMIAGNIGNGALIYEGRQGTDNEAVSVWEILLFGGARMGQHDQFTSTKFGVMTGPNSMFKRAAEKIATKKFIIRR